jgi:hypothetical protein
VDPDTVPTRSRGYDAGKKVNGALKLGHLVRGESACRHPDRDKSSGSYWKPVWYLPCADRHLEQAQDVS